jgi:hypothetical protein
MFLDVVDGADIGVVQQSRSTRFLEKPSPFGFAGVKTVWKEFEGDGTCKLKVLGLVDDTHAAFTKLFEDPVMGNYLADHCINPIFFKIARKRG